MFAKPEMIKSRKIVAEKYNTPRFDWVDGVKAFAIIAIILNHVIELYTAGPWFSNPSYDWPPFAERIHNLIPAGSNIVSDLIIFLGWLGDMGPGVFILLSGFTLALSQSHKKYSAGNFYKKRLLRIFPLYITIHILILAFLVIKKSNFSYNLTDIVLSLLGLRFNDFLFFFINPSWWFVWLILQLYLVFPVLFKLLDRNKRLFIVATLLFTLLSRAAGLFHLSYSNSLYYWMTGLFFGTRLFEFSFGMLLGVLYFQNSKLIFNILNNPLRTLLISLSIYLMGFLCSLTYYSTMVSNILITIGLSGLFYGFFSIFKNAHFLGRNLQWIGKQSFPVFLLHQPVILYLSKNYSGISSLLLVILFLIASFPLGYILYKIIDMAGTSFTKYKKQVQKLVMSGYLRYSICFILLVACVYNLFFDILITTGTFISKLIIIGSYLLLLIYWISESDILSRIKITSTFVLTVFFSLFLFVLPFQWINLFSLVSIPLILIIALSPRLSNKILFNSFYLILVILVVLSLEFFLRKNMPVEVGRWGEFPALRPDKKTVYSLIPNKTTHLRYNNYNYVVKTNSMGFTSPEVDLSSKDSATYRIFITGDAFSMPEGVDYAFSFPCLLEKELNKDVKGRKFQVINGGVTGYGPNEELAQIRNYVDTLKPDLIAIEFFINDFEDINCNALERLQSIGFFRNESLRLKLLGYSQVPVYFEELFRKATGLIDNQYNYNKSLLYLYEKKSAFYSDSVLKKIDGYLGEVKKICDRKGSDLLLVYVPGQIEVSSEDQIAFYPRNVNLSDTSLFDFGLAHQIVHAVCEKHSINLLDTKEMLKNDPNQPVYFKESWHWNQEGHKLIAHELALKIIAGLKNNEQK